MNSVDKLAKAILNSNADRSTKPYDTEAIVTMVDGDTAYVHIPDGVAETPAKMVVNAKEGDSVRVRVAGGRAYVTGNATAPPTDDTTALKAESAASRASRAANIADMKAEAASKAADSATKDAAVAHKAADSAVADAAVAKEAADVAQTSANTALASAQNASEYASRALNGLSTVQNVTETLNWITQHGTMTLTTDTALDPTHVYFVQDNDGDYIVGNTHYSLVIEPDIADISTYYELSIDESLNNYVATHLAVDSEGLWILPDAGGNKVLISTGQGSVYTNAGTYIIGKVNNVDTILAVFGADGAQIGQNGDTHLSLGAGSIKAFSADSMPFFDVDMGGGTTWVTEHANSDVARFSGSSSATVRFDKTFTVLTHGVPLPSGSVVSNGRADLTITTSNRFATGTSSKSLTGCTLISESSSEVVVRLNLGDTEISDSYKTIAKVVANETNGGTLTVLVRICLLSSGNISLQLTRQRSVSDATTVTLELESLSFWWEIEVNAPSLTFGTRYIKNDGFFSSTLGESLYAPNDHQVVVGKYNDHYAAGLNYALIVGNGTDDANRSNAFAVGWDGNINMALDTTSGSGTDYDLYQAITALGWQNDVIV